MPNYPSGYQKTLVDSFFFDQDQQLLQDFRKRMEKVDRRAQLIQVSGIHDEAVLDHLDRIEYRSGNPGGDGGRSAGRRRLGRRRCPSERTRGHL